VIDFDKAASQNRMFVVDLQEGKVRSYKVAHGENSGPVRGVATRFTNLGNGSHQSSLGCSVATFDSKIGKKGRKVPLTDGKGRHKLMFHGFDNSDAKHTNNRICNRSIFMHPAWYVGGGGRSWGCPAVEPGKRAEIYGQIGGGGLVCAYRDGDTTIGSASPPRKLKPRARRANRRR
jgi:hypothetical protein